MNDPANYALLKLIAVCILSAVSVGSALGVVLARQAVHSALWLTGNLLSAALIYLCLSFQFLAAAQLVIYVGAIMVVFLFAVTVLAPNEDLGFTLKEGTQIFGAVVGVVLGGGLIATAWSANVTVDSMGQPPLTIAAFAVQLFGRYVVPFECTAFVLLVALIGAVLLGHRRLKSLSQEARRA